jgi:hypothetical protein
MGLLIGWSYRIDDSDPVIRWGQVCGDLKIIWRQSIACESGFVLTSVSMGLDLFSPPDV